MIPTAAVVRMAHRNIRENTTIYCSNFVASENINMHPVKFRYMYTALVW